MADVRSGLDPKDYRYLRKKADPGFSPERNKAIIEETIKEAEDWYRKFYNAKDKDLENRVDILSSYARYRFNRGVKDLKAYLGPDLYKEIAGEKIIEKLRVASATNKLSGKPRLKKGILV